MGAEHRVFVMCICSMSPPCCTPRTPAEGSIDCIVLLRGGTLRPRRARCPQKALSIALCFCREQLCDRDARVLIVLGVSAPQDCVASDSCRSLGAQELQ